jgi:two-component system sensor histidine kinase KdpD
MMTRVMAFLQARRAWQRFAGETLLVVGSIALLTLLFQLLHLATRTSDGLLLYLLAVLLFACLRGLYPALLASFVAFFAFDYFFVPPVYDLGASKFEDILSLVVFLLVAIITGQLASSLRVHVVRARRREYEARTLYEFMRATNRNSDMQQQMDVFLQTLTSVFASAGVLDCMLLLPAPDGKLRPLGGEKHLAGVLQFDELTAAEWVMRHARPADLYPSSPASMPPAERARTQLRRKLPFMRLLPLQSKQKVCGVLLLLLEEDEHTLWPAKALGVSQQNPTALNTFFSAFLEQAVMVLEQAHLREKSIHLEVLQQTEAQRAALFSSVSHDLRTPLATIRAAATTFLQDASHTEAHDTLALTIEQEVNRLDSWIENVLDMSRLEAGSLRLDKVWYPLDELVQDAAGRVQFSTQKREIRVTHPENLPPAEIDPVQIEQVMVNLLENALRYSPPDTPLEVSIELREQAFLVSVADRGPGIPEGERERIFEKFYRLADERTARAHPQGLGLGLAICQGCVRAHGGQIWVEARAGGGARFCFTLPLTMISEEDIDE